MQYLYRHSAFLFLAVALLIPLDGLAQTVKNEIGLYTDLAADPSSASIDIGVGIAFDVYMVVINPVNEEYTPEDCGEPFVRPINLIPGMQFKLLKPESGMITLDEQPNGIVSGRITLDDEYLIVLEEPIFVPESRNVLLVTYKLMVIDLDPKYLFLQQTVNQPQNANGLVIIDGEEGGRGNCDEWSDLQDLYPSSGDIILPVFGINASVVAVDKGSWGGVKALFR